MKTDQPTPRSILEERLKGLAHRMLEVEKSPDDPAKVHDFRVAIRHFSQALRTFPDVFGQGFAKKMRRQLKKMMSKLGDVRNRDIAPEILRTAKAGPEENLLKAIRDEREGAHKRLASLLKSWRKREVLRDWKARLRDRAGGAQSFEQARLQLPGLAGEFFQAGNYAARHKVPYRRLHRCRLLGKRLRYTMEMFNLDRTPQFKSRFKVLRHLQDQLGALNDSVTVMALIQGHPAVKWRLRLLRAQQEKSFRSFWKRKFDSHAQDWWLHVLIPDQQERART